MKILDYAIYLDLFGENSKLLINQKTKMRSYLGLLVSFFTYIIFILILSYELQEVIYKQTPNIIVNEFDSMFYNSTISFNENAFKLVLVQDIDDLAKYFTFRGYFVITHRVNNKPIQKFKKFNFSKCNDEELDIDFKSLLKDQKMFNNKTTLCPRNLYSKEYEDLTNTYVVVRVDLECKPELSDCIHNQTIYDGMRKGKIRPFSYFNLFRTYMQNVFDSSDKPLIPKIKYDNNYFGKDTVNIDYYSGFNELITKENYIINQSKKETHYLYKKREVKTPTKPDLSSTISFYFQSNTIKVTVRSYKGLLTALANSFSLIRLALFIIKKFVKYHVDYLIDETIIRKNFYSEKEEIYSYNPINNTINANRQTFLKQTFIDKKPVKLTETKKIPIQKRKLTMWNIYSNISCWRYFLCRKQNGTLLFYNEAKKVVNKYLSAEHLLYCLIGLERLKSIEVEEKRNSYHPADSVFNDGAKIAYEINQNNNEKSINENLTFDNM
jgi:hypothetical protein